MSNCNATESMYSHKMHFDIWCCNTLFVISYIETALRYTKNLSWCKISSYIAECFVELQKHFQ